MFRIATLRSTVLKAVLVKVDLNGIEKKLTDCLFA